MTWLFIILFLFIIFIILSISSPILFPYYFVTFSIIIALIYFNLRILFKCFIFILQLLLLLLLLLFFFIIIIIIILFNLLTLKFCRKSMEGVHNHIEIEYLEDFLGCMVGWIHWKVGVNVLGRVLIKGSEIKASNRNPGCI